MSWLGAGGGGLRRVLGIVVVVAAVGLLRPGAVIAQTCGTDYTIKEGETLAQIAARIYGNPSQWTIIFYANQDRLGTNESLLVPGLALRLPCIGGSQQPSLCPRSQLRRPNRRRRVRRPSIISSLLRRVEFLTADGFSPYTGRSLEGGGMLTQVIGTAMGLVKDESKGRFDYGISWVNDWAAHLNPLLLTRAFDVGLPLGAARLRGQLNLDQSSQFRCQRFFFSDPLYEVITSLFVRANSRIKTLRNEEIAGTTLCRPAGYADARARPERPQLGQGRQGHSDTPADRRRVLPSSRQRHGRRRGRGRARRAGEHDGARARRQGARDRPARGADHLPRADLESRILTRARFSTT